MIPLPWGPQVGGIVDCRYGASGQIFPSLYILTYVVCSSLPTRHSSHGVHRGVFYWASSVGVVLFSPHFILLHGCGLGGCLLLSLEDRMEDYRLPTAFLHQKEARVGWKGTEEGR
ncbi:hypothetical protein CC80DRAFT_168442 [Byssothecium circinans]|uniref:Uncharacterized protein n=1 Tax=Byssothecium circinans TaxID=147558 RepID=A0A6A5TL27_9PLEO|nr:hypothetical protein CC80DRAFT_168442 [Byssothecium circinans]